MLIKAFSKLVLFIGPFIVIWYTFVYFDGEQYAEDWTEAHFSHRKPAVYSWEEPDLVVQQNIVSPSEPKPVADGLPTAVEELSPESIPDPTESPPALFEILPPSPAISDNTDAESSAYRYIVSASTADKKYFSIDFGPDNPTMNPNVIPHPYDDNTWIVVAQRIGSPNAFEELVCNAHFHPDGSLICTAPPTVLPVTPSSTQNCHDDLGHFAASFGPHDMRVFFGPDAPYAIYGSQSAHTCFSLFTQDFRSLHHAEYALDALNAHLFAGGTELQRPAPWNPVEKNWYMFWDAQNAPYVHVDVAPKRVFAQLLPDGSVGPDLSPMVAANDEKCMQRYMPKVDGDGESIHQATNALAVIMCTRGDESCRPTDANTFILTIFQHKRYRDFHATYEPYVMLTQSVPPFAVHAISTKPMWIHGRGALTRESAARYREEGMTVPEGQTEMLYVTSVNWKEKAVHWRGYLDDIVMIGFGVEDERSAGVDLVVGDLLGELGFCGEGGG
jgi:hypothetical protein